LHIGGALYLGYCPFEGTPRPLLSQLSVVPLLSSFLFFLPQHFQLLAHLDPHYFFFFFFFPSLSFFSHCDTGDQFREYHRFFSKRDTQLWGKSKCTICCFDLGTTSEPGLRTTGVLEEELSKQLLVFFLVFWFFS
jgi:hypothetical protein